MEFIIEFINYALHMVMTGFGIGSIVLAIVFGIFIRPMVKRWDNVHDVNSEKVEA